MAGLLRKSMLYLGLVDDEADYDDEAEEEAPRSGVARYTPDPVPPPARRPVEPVRRSAPLGGSAGSALGTALDYRITTLQPRIYNDARAIGEHFREGVPVIMNVTDMDDADAKRLVDFAAGLTFGLRGTLERVTSKVFLLSPSNVTLSQEDKARLAEGGFFNQS